jgi:glycosyltransferase involved in cell wall biosynthesis
VPTTSLAIRVVHLAQSDSEGGANRAAYRLHRALREAGVDSKFHAGRKLGDDPSTIPVWPSVGGRAVSEWVARLNALVLRAYPRRQQSPFSPVRLSYGRLEPRHMANADVVCLHWIAGALLRPADLAQIGRPLVWRLSDLWPFTGGCHYPGACRRFEETCGQCPMLGSRGALDLSRLDFAARRRAYPKLDLTVVAPSRWIAGHARRSTLFRDRPIEHIATGVDLALYRPHDRDVARAKLDLPLKGSLVLFGALGATDDPRKGYRHLNAALRQLAASERAAGIALAVFGGPGEPPRSEALPLPARHVGRIDDERRLALLYAAADVFVAPFLEDNLPNVVLESLACGTPVVAFAAGGIPEAVEHEKNGYLAPVGDTAELARGIAWVLSEPERHARLRQAARATAEARFDLAQCAQRYVALFQRIAARQQAPSALD